MHKIHIERLLRVANSFVYSVTLKQGKVVDSQNYPGCEVVTGYAAEEYNQDIDLWRRMIHPDDVDKVINQVREWSAGKPVVKTDYRIIHRNGGTRWLRNTSIARRDEEENLIGYEGLVTDITDFKQSEAEREILTGQLREMAFRDALTGLMNRRGFEEELNRVWNLALRHTYSLGMLVMDIDHFKALNDSYGHLVGDQVLGEAARLVLDHVRSSDVVSRLGGDEIMVILPEVKGEDTRLVANRILQSFQSHIFCKGSHDLQVTVSIGTAALIPDPDVSARRFLTMADKALYRAKQLGRNRVCEWESPLC